MHDANARIFRQTARGFRSTKWILHLAQMANDGHVEAAPALETATTQRHSRLVHDANLVAKPSGYALASELLQRHEPAGAGERTQNRGRIAIDVVVDVGSAQADDQRPIGVQVAKGADAVGAAPGMERNH